MSDSVKLQKYIADAGLMSRRAAEREIEAGAVTVNGVTAHLGDRIDPETAEVAVQGKIVTPGRGTHTYIMLNKPAGVVTTMKDEKEKDRRTVADLVSDVGARVYPVGRLDMYSDGLLLMTDDGELANALSHPRGGGEKVYRVSFPRYVSDDILDCLSRPMTITEADGKPYKLLPCGVRLISRDSASTVIEMTLHEGRNRQIRRMCDAVGIKISRLTRISEGGLSLGDLRPGKWRRLTDEEIDVLKKGIHENALRNDA